MAGKKQTRKRRAAVVSRTESRSGSDFTTNGTHGDVFDFRRIWFTHDVLVCVLPVNAIAQIYSLFVKLNSKTKVVGTRERNGRE